MLVPHIAGFSPVTSCMIVETLRASLRFCSSLMSSRNDFTLVALRWVFSGLAILLSHRQSLFIQELRRRNRRVQSRANTRRLQQEVLREQSAIRASLNHDEADPLKRVRSHEPRRE